MDQSYPSGSTQIANYEQISQMIVILIQLVLPVTQQEITETAGIF